MTKFLKPMLIVIIIFLIAGITVAAKSIIYEVAQNKQGSSPVNVVDVDLASPSSSPANSTLNNTPQKTTPGNTNSNTASSTKGSVQTTPTPVSKTVAPALTPPPVKEISKLVVIDAGHGGVDPGTSDFGMVEKNVTLDIAVRLESILKNAGIKTYMIRNDDSYMDHRDRIKLANSMNASLYISIHLDWFKDRTVNGTTTYYINNKSLAVGNLNEIQYAQNIQRELIKKLNTNDRRLIERPDLAALKYATMPSALVELAFLSNKGNADLLATKDFRQKCAEGLAEGIRLSLEKIGQ